MLPKLIDSHCHIPHKKYDKTVQELLGNAKSSGVEKVITIGTSIKDNAKTLKIAAQYKEIYSAIGIYPHEDKDKSTEELKLELSKQIDSSNKVVGIGECGIDITKWNGGRELTDQIELFEMQAELALEKKLPLVIHNRNGDIQVLEVLNRYKSTRLIVVIHCFVSDWDFAKKILDLGGFLSFSGIITYNSGVEIHETVKKAPLDRILVETDAPYLSPGSLRKVTNEPMNVTITAQKIAELRGLEFAQICEITRMNTCNFFGL